MHRDYQGKTALSACTVSAPTVLEKVEIWKFNPTHQGFRDAQKNHVSEPPPKECYGSEMETSLRRDAMVNYERFLS